jgi:glutamyl-tRNA synthetase
LNRGGGIGYYEIHFVFQGGITVSDSVRVRFAPSPTGHLHIGGARTALFNWLYARHNKDTFVLRIEDTDTTRSTDEYIEAIIEGMKWLGLDWDEGPFRQTDRFDVYRSYVDRLLAEGKAYRCYCTTDELEHRREQATAEGKTPKYDGRCRKLTAPIADKPYTVRFKMPENGVTVIDDMIKGRIEFDNSLLDDMIILRTDSTPTYNFVVVVDDIDMKITHVIRGDDHVNNTPKQLHIYLAFGWEPPKFAHLPMILGADKARLSKRHGATSVMAYKDMGYLPQALVNYLVRLGWSHGDQEIFSTKELVEFFSFENVGSSASVFNPEKLLWLNSQYIINTPANELAELVLPFLEKAGLIDPTNMPDMQWLAKAAFTLRERVHTLVELAHSMKYYLVDDVEIDPKAKEKFLKPEALKLLADLKETLAKCDDFTHDGIEKTFAAVVEKNGTKLGNLAQPARVAITGGTASPGIFEVLEIVGKDRVIKRLEKVIGG